LLREDFRKSKKVTLPGYAIMVSDSGPGIPKEFSHRVFEPLFSTKISPTQGSKSIGTGLGLTVVNSIVRDLNGKVTFDKDPILKGARFKVWLPLEKN
jgi:signal transduction histidine kinase